MKTLGCIGILAVVVTGAVLGGLALSVMWDWFIVPTFDAPQLSIPAAIGIALVVGYLTHHGQTSNKPEKKEDAIIELLVWSIGQPLFYLALGYIVHLFM
jgi:NhaP-type Na+/H+ or K+/H+ antiporter